MESMIGRGRDAIAMIVDPDSFAENRVGCAQVPEGYGPGAVVGTASLNGRPVTILANDAQAVNPRFPVVYFGVIGMEEAYKMASAVYESILADRDKPVGEKRPLLLIVDTPGNGPGKVEEIFGMNKATGAYQLALAEARKAGHAVIAMVIGRAISGAFLCHGLQADHILALPKECGTMIHVMPLTSISRITKMDIERLEEQILEGCTRVNRAMMMADTRRMLGLDAFYQGMSDLTDLLAEKGGSVVAPGDRAQLRMLSRQLDRLSTRLESLQDYSLQLNGLYQEEIDIRQNSVMQWLTVIATIFMPLTFITGWYGMNFPTMAMLQEPWGYPLVVAVCLVIAVAEIVCFHRRGWLHFGGRRRPHPSRHGSARRKTK